MASSTAPAGTRPPGDSDCPPPRRELSASGSAAGCPSVGPSVGSSSASSSGAASSAASASISFSVDPAATSAAGPRNPVEISFAEISPRFTMHTYNLLRWNCNNFSNEVTQFLVGKEIPSHILSLPDDVMNTPLGQQLMPFLNMMEAQMRTASEQGVGQGGMHQWTPPSGREGVHSLAPATAVEYATGSTATAEEAAPSAFAPTPETLKTPFAETGPNVMRGSSSYLP